MNPNQLNALMSPSAAASRYQGVQVKTASPAQLVAMMYGGVLRFTNEAIAAMNADDRARTGDRIGRAMALIDELTSTLDPEKAPELAENLFSLYDFSRRRLFDANANRDPKALADVIAAITPLYEAFSQLAK